MPGAGNSSADGRSSRAGYRMVGSTASAYGEGNGNLEEEVVAQISSLRTEMFFLRF